MLRTIAASLLVVGLPVAALFAADTATTPQQGAAGGSPPSVQGQAAPNAGASPAAPNSSAQAPSGQAGGAQTSGGADQAAAGGGNSQDVAKSTEKGKLKSPYPDFAKVAEEGHQKFMSAGCNGCHGGTGGGGMGPPLTNQIWVYGSDDDTLFRLIALGTDEFQKQGYSRKGSENVVGPMPPMGTVLKTPDDIWKVIAWIRSVNPSSAGGPSAAAAPAPAAPQ